MEKAFIRTFTGKTFYPLAPRSEDIDILDIAHALSLLCRFTGHTKNFYSVAEHCARVSLLVPKQYALAGLLHDASEAYLADLSRPVKQATELAMYREAEENLEKVLADRFGFDVPLDPSIKAADRIMCATEMRDLMGGRPYDWGRGIEPYPWTIYPWTSAEAETRFLDRFVELTGLQEAAISQPDGFAEAR